MVYLTYSIVFKNGKNKDGNNSSDYIVEIEPHEEEKIIKEYNENQIKFSNQFSCGIQSIIILKHTEGLAMFSTEEVSRVNICKH